MGDLGPILQLNDQLLRERTVWEAFPLEKTEFVDVEVHRGGITRLVDCPRPHRSVADWLELHKSESHWKF